VKRWILTILAGLAALLVVAPLTAFAVLILAGPHAGLLSQPLEVGVVLLGWVVVLGVPVRIARRVWTRLAPALFFLLACPTLAADGAAPAGYRVHQSIDLDRGRDGAAGRIELIQDERLTEARREEMEGGDFGTYCGDDTSDPFCNSLRRVPPRPAVVRWIGPEGRVRDSRVLERELAWMERRDLEPDGALSFSVTVDRSIGMGSYAGPVTTFFHIRRGRIHEIAARDVDSGEYVPLRVLHSLKTDWRLYHRYEDAIPDILEFACRPERDVPGTTDEPVRFELVYRRFDFDGRRWVRRERREPGFWEHDTEFPPRERFP
jgi:hypothetical protein